MEEQGCEKFPGYVFEDEDDSLLLKDVDDCDSPILSAEEFAAAIGAKLDQVAILPEADTTGFSYLPNVTGKSERLARKFGNIIRFASGRWFVWNGKRWAPDHYRKLDRMAKYVGKELLAEADGIEDEKERKGRRSFALACGNRARRTNMIDLSSTMRGVLKLPTDFDQDLWAFNGSVSVTEPTQLSDLFWVRFCLVSSHSTLAAPSPPGTPYGGLARGGSWFRYARAFFAFSERICFVHSRMASSEPGETFFCHFSNRSAAFSRFAKNSFCLNISRAFGTMGLTRSHTPKNSPDVSKNS
jgi:hypothetical protein